MGQHDYKTFQENVYLKNPTLKEVIKDVGIAEIRVRYYPKRPERLFTVFIYSTGKSWDKSKRFSFVLQRLNENQINSAINETMTLINKLYNT